MKRAQEDRQGCVERFDVTLTTRKSQMRPPCMSQVQAVSYAGIASRIVVSAPVSIARWKEKPACSNSTLYSCRVRCRPRYRHGRDGEYHAWLGLVSTAAHFTLAYTQQSRGSVLILGCSTPRRINPSRSMPIFSITRADAVLSTSHMAQTRYIAGCAKR